MATTLNISGARGESFADVARRLGNIGSVPIPPDATDEEVLEALQSTSILQTIDLGTIATPQDALSLIADWADGLNPVGVRPVFGLLRLHVTKTDVGNLAHTLIDGQVDSHSAIKVLTTGDILLNSGYGYGAGIRAQGDSVELTAAVDSLTGNPRAAGLVQFGWGGGATGGTMFINSYGTSRLHIYSNGAWVRETANGRFEQEVAAVAGSSVIIEVPYIGSSAIGATKEWNTSGQTPTRSNPLFALRQRPTESTFKALVIGTYDENTNARVDYGFWRANGAMQVTDFIGTGNIGQSTKVPGYFPNIAAKKVFIANVGVGHNDIGPVPAGKKWLFLGFQWANGSGSSVTLYPEFKTVGGVYKRAGVNTAATGSGSPGLTYPMAAPNSTPLLMYAGEYLSINGATNAGAIVYGGELWEFDDTSPLERAYVDVIAARTATYTPGTVLFTVPGGRNAEIGIVPLTGTLTGQGVAAINQTGAARTFNLHRVPSGGTADATNLAFGFGSATNDSAAMVRNIGGLLTAGETIQVSADVAAGPAMCVYVLR